MTREVWRRLYPAVYIHPRRKSILLGHGAEASATDGRALWEATMSYDEYCRLHMACLDMARQASLPDVRARWLAMAGAWLKESRPMCAMAPIPWRNVLLRRAYTDQCSAHGRPAALRSSLAVAVLNRRLVFASN
jgi:hypothetical protein